MRMCIRALVLASVISLALAAGASAASQPSTTKQMPRVPCSVTAYGPSFTLSNGKQTMSYGGGVSCAGGIGQKTINVVPQVFNVVNGRPLWFNISLVGLYQGPTPINPLRVSGSTTSVASHVYRLLVYGQVMLPDGRSASATVCAGNCVGSPTLSIRPSSTYVSQLASTVKMQGVPCWIGHHELVFSVVNSSLVISYGGLTICAADIGQRSLTVCAQVVNPRITPGNLWFTIDGSCLSQGPSRVNLVELRTARTAYTGHAYRITVSATIKYPSSHGTISKSATIYSGLGNP